MFFGRVSIRKPLPTGEGTRRWDSEGNGRQCLKPDVNAREGLVCALPKNHPGDCDWLARA